MRALLVLSLMMPGYAFAAGSDTMAPPKTTKTTKSCKGIKVYDASRKKCVNPKGSSLETDTLYQAARELAYAGRYDDAQGVLSAMPDQRDDRVLTYWGFTHRKMGQADLAQAFYQQAIAQNPDNLLARSYMAQGFVEQGNRSAAMEQWREIKARGGEGSWPETSLRQALLTGSTYQY
ncbi:MAG: tetratricopeptide repeat protein [Sedimentitalea sp.]